MLDVPKGVYILLLFFSELLKFLKIKKNFVLKFQTLQFQLLFLLK